MKGLLHEISCLELRRAIAEEVMRIATGYENERGDRGSHQSENGPSSSSPK
jgi:hypothetical protein